MTSRLEGKVAFITGAGRGQGRSHAVRFAEEGADIIAVDLCQNIDSNPYPLSTPEDLAETERLVKALGRRIVARRADVRERSELKAALDDGLRDLGRLDIVVANAGILPFGDPAKPNVMDFVDAVDVDFIGVMNTCAIAIPHLKDFASVIVTGSTAALMPGTTGSDPTAHGGVGYAYAKRSLVEYVEVLALRLAPQMIRVNAVHPTNCDTHLIHNDYIYKLFRPDLEEPTREDAVPAFAFFQAMPIPYVEPADVSNAVLVLASEEARYITGQQLRVDAGSLLRWPNGPTG